MRACVLVHVRRIGGGLLRRLQGFQGEGLLPTCPGYQPYAEELQLEAPAEETPRDEI